MKLQPITDSQRIEIVRGAQLLREARECFKRGNCPKTVRRVRLAITSAGGALRHASTRKWAKGTP